MLDFRRCAYHDETRWDKIVVSSLRWAPTAYFLALLAGGQEQSWIELARTGSVVVGVLLLQNRSQSCRSTLVAQGGAYPAEWLISPLLFLYAVAAHCPIPDTLVASRGWSILSVAVPLLIVWSLVLAHRYRRHDTTGQGPFPSFGRIAGYSLLALAVVVAMGGWASEGAENARGRLLWFAMVGIASALALVTERLLRPEDAERTRRSLLWGLGMVVLYGAVCAGGMWSALGKGNRLIADGEYRRGIDVLSRAVLRNNRTLQIPAWSSAEVIRLPGASAENRWAKLVLRSEICQGAKSCHESGAIDSLYSSSLYENAGDVADSLVYFGLESWVRLLLAFDHPRRVGEVSGIGLMRYPNNDFFRVAASMERLKFGDFEAAAEMLVGAVASYDVGSALRAHLTDGYSESLEGNLRDQVSPSLQYFLNCLSLDQASRLGDKLGLYVVSPGEEIGATGVVTPVDIRIRSLGTDYKDGRSEMAYVSIDGSPNLIDGWPRGYTVFVVDSVSGRLLARRTFDTYGDPNAGSSMLGFIDEVKDGDIVVCVTFDEASASATSDVLESLKLLGAGSVVPASGRIPYAWTYGSIGVRGSQAGSAVETLHPRFLALSAVAPTIPPSWAPLPLSELTDSLTLLSGARGRPILFLRGRDKDAEFLYVDGKAR